MITGKTSTGFEFSVDEKVLNDWSLQECLSDIASEDEAIMIRGTINFTKTLLGDKGYKDLKKHIKKRNDGFIPVDAMNAEITEIMTSSKDIKNL